MFSDSTVPLMDFSGRFGLEVVRDCAMAFIGKVPTRLDGRVVPCGQRRHIVDALAETGIVGIITTSELAEDVPDHLGLAIADRPQASAYLLHEALCELPGFHWVRFPTRIAPSATVHAGAIVNPFDVVIGPGSVIFPGAVICERAVIGADCVIGPGAVIGCDAFEVDVSRSPTKIMRQAGGVWLEDHVEIQAKSTIVRATFGGFTKLGAETKIDCQVHVAHDCIVGRRVRMAACAEISGRVSIGDDVFIGPNCSVSNGLNIGAGATVTIGAVVVRDVEAGTRVTGNFALQHAKWLKFIRSIR